MTHTCDPSTSSSTEQDLSNQAWSSHQIIKQTILSNVPPTSIGLNSSTQVYYGTTMELGETRFLEWHKQKWIQFNTLTFWRASCSEQSTASGGKQLRRSSAMFFNITSLLSWVNSSKSPEKEKEIDPALAVFPRLNDHRRHTSHQCEFVRGLSRSQHWLNSANPSIFKNPVFSGCQDGSVGKDASLRL